MYKKILTILFVFSFFLYASPKPASADTIIFEDDFSKNDFDVNWDVHNYVEEKHGIYASYKELSLGVIEDYLNIYGTGIIGTVIIDNQISGNIGRAATLKQALQSNTNSAIETLVNVKSGTNLSVGLNLEFNPNNRIRLVVFDINLIGLTLDENGVIRIPRKFFPFTHDEDYHLKLEYNSESKLVRGYINNIKEFETIFLGEIGEYRAGVSATVRFPGDTLDARFNNFKLIATDGGASSEVPHLSQSDERWGDEEYDHAEIWDPAVSNTSISRWGCALTSANMILQYHGVSDVLPGELNEWLKDQHDGFTDGGGVKWNTIGRYGKEHGGNTALEFKYLKAIPTEQQIKTEISSGHPPILKLNNKFGNYHFVVATKVIDDVIHINDSGRNEHKTLEDATNYWGSLADMLTYHPVNSNLSYIVQYITEGFQIKLSSTKGILSESFEEGSLVNVFDPEEFSGPSINTLYHPKPDNGKYLATISGEVGLYQLDNSLYDLTGYSNSSSYVGLLAYEGDEDVYEIEFDQENNSNSYIINPETTYESLITDLKGINQLGKIHNRGLYRSIHQLLVNSKKLYESNLSLPAEILLNIVLDRVQSETPENIDKEYSNYLIQEIEALLANL